jgi:putative hydrolase of the HAD superfamily
MADPRPVILFDWGETLVRIPGMVHTPDAHLACARSAFHAEIRPRFEARGRALDEARFMACYEAAARDHIRRSGETLREHRFEERLLAALALAEAPDVIGADHALAFATHLGDRVLEGFTLEHPDVPAVLRTLAERHRLGIVSNYPFGPVVSGSLERMGVADLFGAVVVSGEIGWSKPHPEIFRHALAAMDADPARTLFVGDNPVADMQGAKRAGMATAWYAPARAAVKPVEADIHVEHLGELVPWCAARLH